MNYRTTLLIVTIALLAPLHASAGAVETVEETWSDIDRNLRQWTRSECNPAPGLIEWPPETITTFSTPTGSITEPSYSLCPTMAGGCTAEEVIESKTSASGWGIGPIWRVKYSSSTTISTILNCGGDAVLSFYHYGGVGMRYVDTMVETGAYVYNDDGTVGVGAPSHQECAYPGYPTFCTTTHEVPASFSIVIPGRLTSLYFEIPYEVYNEPEVPLDALQELEANKNIRVYPPVKYVGQVAS